MSLLSSLFGGNSSSDSKTRVSEKNDEVRVRNSSVVYDRDSGKHDTVWSNTTVNVNTGEAKYNEGAHGPNYSK